MRILVVRLSALGDLVHTVPMVSALRRGFPSATIDWLVDERFRAFVELVSGVDRSIPWPRSGSARLSRLLHTVSELRRARYDLALDAQGLLKSAVAARLANARRVIGFHTAQLREPVSRWFYTEQAPIASAAHVINKGLALASHLGLATDAAEFALLHRPTPVVQRIRDALGITAHEGFVLMNPGAAWPSKRWRVSGFGDVASRVKKEFGLSTAVCWGPGERDAAEAVATGSGGAATVTPPTDLADLVALARAATLVVAGDTGPLHVAAACGTPVVALYGPSDPERNGPWSPDDVVVSPASGCACATARRQSGSRGVVIRRCREERSCLDEVEPQTVVDAIRRRLDP